jgi:hypothetical protein
LCGVVGIWRHLKVLAIQVHVFKGKRMSPYGDIELIIARLARVFYTDGMAESHEECMDDGCDEGCMSASRTILNA